MSEPTKIATSIAIVVPGILHWTVDDDRINFRSDAYAVESSDGVILIDPLPLVDDALRSLKNVAAICLTGGFHQRSAWRYRERFGVPLFAPKGAQGREGEPDIWYEAGTELPGGLEPIHAPGPAAIHFVVHHRRPTGNALFIADLLIRKDQGTFRFVSDRYVDDPIQARRSANQLLDLDFEILCSDHGAPEPTRGRAALLAALERDEQRRR